MARSGVKTARFSARNARAEAAATDAASGKKKQGGGARLNDVTRLEIIAKVTDPNRPSLRKIALQYDVNEATIRHIRDRASAIKERALAVPEEVRKTTLRVVQKTFPELEDRVAEWIAETERANGNTSFEYVKLKAQEIAMAMRIPEHEFDATPVWLKNFQRRQAAKTAAREKAQLEAAARALVPHPVAAATTGVSPHEPVVVTTVGEKRKRGSGPRLSDGQRLEIIQKLNLPEGPSNRKLAEEFNVDEATIRHIKANAATIEQRALSVPVDIRQTTFRAGKTKFADLETIIAEWIDVSRRCNEEIPPAIVRKKALEVAAELEIPDGEFKATVSWYNGFCKRQGVGTATPVDNLEEIITSYDPNNVYTVDETGLFYRLLPRAHLLLPGEDTITEKGKQKTMERVSLVLCCNATGTERLPVSMISKQKAPRCMTPGTEWPLPVFHQAKSWIDAKVFTKWFDTLFLPHVAQRHGAGDSSKVLLLLDNAPGHPISFEKGNIRVVALPPNNKAWLPPMEMGVFTALKNRYKWKLIKDLIAYHTLPTDVKDQLAAGFKSVRKGSAGVFFGKAPHLLDAARRVAESWAEISPELLRCSFEEAEIIPQFKSQTKRTNQTAIAVEAQEFKVEEEMLRILSVFCQAHATGGGVHETETLAQDLQTYLHLDDESAEAYQKCIMDDVDNDDGGTSDIEANANGSVSSDDDEDAMEGTSGSNAMNRILNDANPASVSDVLHTSILLGIQLRQLDASSIELDAKQIEKYVVATDNLRRQFQSVGVAMERRR
ncbi:Jerky protein, partial [Globisporangium splendens]